jgi:isopenicillin-N N-acyltransferase like protein
MTRFAILFVALLTTPPCPAKEAFRYPEGKHGKGELKYVNGVPVLTVEGSPEEIGEAVGVLGIKPAKGYTNVSKEFLKKTSLDKAWPLLVRSCEAMLKRMPEPYLRELDAMAKSSGVERELLLVLNTFMDLSKLVGCSTIVVEPNRSATGELLFGRNLDIPVVENIHEFSLIMVYRPKGKRAFVSAGFPGVLIGGSLMNDAGLCLAINEIYSAADKSPRFEAAGKPWVGFLRQTMEDGASVADVQKMAKEHAFTTLDSITACDTKTGSVLEVTTRTVKSRGAENGLCFCTNHFLIPGLTLEQKCHRFEKLEKSRAHAKWGVDDVAKCLHEVNQGIHTAQSFVFEPSRLTVHVGLGRGPVTGRPFKKIDFSESLKRR